jgi:predicted nucleic acid-binding protein
MRQIRVVDRFFIDSNILLYTVGPDIAKGVRATELVLSRPIISVQVLNEFVNVARKKLKLDWVPIETSLESTLKHCRVVSLTLDTHSRAVEFSKNDNIGIYDANIVAAAELSGCDILYSEDMNDGQRIGRVTIRNPFK